MKRRHPRDTQRQRLYRAERRTFDPARLRGGAPGASAVEAPFDIRAFENVAEIQAYVDRIERSAWFRREFPTVKRHVVVREEPRASRFARGGGGEIVLPTSRTRWAHKDYTVLHEFAHNISPEVRWVTCEHDDLAGCGAVVAPGFLDGSKKLHPEHYASHGPEFARVFYELVYRWMGREAAFALGRAYRAEKVRKTSKIGAGMKGG